MYLRKLRSAALLVGVIAATVIAAYAQPGPATGLSGRRFAGETLKYEGKINWMKLSFAVADLTFTSTESPDNSGLLIRADARSRGTLTSLFHFSFVQQIDSKVDTDTFRAARTQKHDVQKERIRDSEAVFDYGQHRVTFIENDPNDKMRAPRRIASKISNPSYDLVSSIYYVRLQDLAVGKKFEVEVSDSGLVYKIPVSVTAREKHDSPFGKIFCWRVEPDIFGPGRLIEKSGSMVIWLTADDRRIPVAAKVDASVGTINVKLKEYKLTAANEAIVKVEK